MIKIKSLLIKLYNKAYDYYLDAKLFWKWRKDLRIQKQYGIPKILSIDETLDKILTEQCSICRFGDGEFKIMDGEGILFQSQDRFLSNRLIEVINSNNKRILICIPSFFDRRKKKQPNGLSKDEIIRYKSAQKYMNGIIANRRLQWYQYFDMERIYGEACVSRFYASIYDDVKSERWINKWKKIWNQRDILIVEGEKTRLGVGNDLFENTKSIARILAPQISAYKSYDTILCSVKKHYQKNMLVLIALGPTATVLAYDLALLGVQAIDIGHIDIEYEWFLRRDRTHKKIENKFVSEAEGGINVIDDNLSDEYLKQIVCTIV